MKRNQSSDRSVSVSPASDLSLTSTEIRWGFGGFILWEGQRRIEAFGQATKLGSRSFDLLLHLLKRAGEVVSKDELLSVVWRDVVVEEASVRVHMSQLRKALGAPGDSDDCKEWISNIPLRGYRFNGRVLRELIDTSPAIRTSASASFNKLPVRLTELVGREAEVGLVLTSLDSHRLVTIVGPGGIGKTSIAIRAAEDRRARSATEVAFVDLAPLISPEHVLGTIARSIEVAGDLPDLLALTEN